MKQFPTVEKTIRRIFSHETTFNLVGNSLAVGDYLPSVTLMTNKTSRTIPQQKQTKCVSLVYWLRLTHQYVTNKSVIFLTL
ncbi:hypothetical protein OH492_08750 [Vibrio chagasii]|nr:hypothetical protein [Vibrio chagasii]